MAEDLIPNPLLTLIAILVGIIGLYGSGLPIVGGIISIIVAVFAATYGTNILRHIGKYSLGTGIPSIVYMLTAIATVGYLLAMILSIQLNQPILFPLLSLISAAMLAVIMSLICEHIYGIQVEILSKSFVSLSVASVLLITAMSTLVSQTFNPVIIYENTIQNGLVIIFMMMSVMVIQHPYNACLGPNEEQYRTLYLSTVDICLMLIILSIFSSFTTKYWLLYVLVSLIGFILSFKQYIKYTKQQAASIKRYGVWPKDDGDE